MSLRSKFKVPFILIILILAFSTILFNAEYIRSITGKATSQQVGISIPIAVPTPTITIISPKNNTYLTNNSLLLNFSGTYYRSTWYNINLGQNFTISSPTYINVPVGQNTLYLWANNTDGVLTSKNVTFVVNGSKFNIIYSSYQNSGNTTNLSGYSFEDLQNATNIALEQQSYGLIRYSGTTNLTNTVNHSTLDLDRFVNISQNHIEINSNEIPGLNHSASLTIRNLAYSNPEILRDGSSCPSTICTTQSYDSGTLVFNVTSFSTYSAQETPSSGGTTNSGSTSSGGGGGGGSSTPSGGSFTIDPQTATIKLKQGETKRREIEIRNDQSSKIDITIDVENIKEYVKLSETHITLAPKEVKTIKIDVFAPEDTSVQTLLGKIIFSSGNEKKEVLMSIDIGSPKALFDVNLDIPQKEVDLEKSRSLVAIIKIINLGETNRVDAIVEYEVFDSDGNSILKETETFAVETQVGLAKEINLPRTLKTGKYLLSVKARYENEIATSSAIFSVIESPNRTAYLVILITVIVLGVISVLIIVWLLIIKKPAYRKPIKSRR